MFSPPTDGASTQTKLTVSNDEKEEDVASVLIQLRLVIKLSSHCQTFAISAQGMQLDLRRPKSHQQL